MKLRKRLTAAAAIAAVCCTMNMPVMAGAGTDGQQKAAPTTCPPHNMVRDAGEYFTTEEVHDYDGENGKLEQCTIITTYIRHRTISCSKCGMSRVEEFIEYIGTRHTNCGK